MRMIQKLYPNNAIKRETFLDGTLPIQQPEGIVEFDEFRKSHWRDELWSRGYRVLVDEDSQEQPPKRPRGRPRKENEGVTDGK